MRGVELCVPRPDIGRDPCLVFALFGSNALQVHHRHSKAFGVDPVDERER